MDILLSGYNGFMGREVRTLADTNYRGARVVAGVDRVLKGDEPVPVAEAFASAETNVDCVVDFSHHDGTMALLEFVRANKLPLVLATTGQTPEERTAIEAAAQEVPLFFAANYSLGIALLIELAKKTALSMPDAEIEIIEKHHDRKIDAPSGTALSIARSIQEVRPQATFNCGRSGQGKRTADEIGIHAIRMGNIVGEHEVIVGTQNQTITLKHEAHSRALFAEGALAAAEWLIGKPAGLYNMEDLLQD